VITAVGDSCLTIHPPPSIVGTTGVAVVRSPPDAQVEKRWMTEMVAADAVLGKPEHWPTSLRFWQPRRNEPQGLRIKKSQKSPEFVIPSLRGISGIRPDRSLRFLAGSE
jgi:hypothetical protein